MTDTYLDADRSPVAAGWRKAIADNTDLLRGAAVVELPACSEGWIDSGIDLSAGETVSLLSTGAVQLAVEPDIRFFGNVSLWWRIGRDGRATKSIGETTTFTASTSGRLFLIAKHPGEWANEKGDFDPGWPRAGASGGFSVAVLAWRDGAAAGLAQFSADDGSRVATAEAARLNANKMLPRGWRPLWRVGDTAIFCEEADASTPAHIACRCRFDAGILQYPVDVALDPTTRLAWSWRVTNLPSALAENSVPTHDYLSIAVEFENGLDLTYAWSASLPVGTAFACPLPWWDKRETHMIVRSGTTDLGRWLEEERPVAEDYARAIGGPLPSRIVGVWLIALSCFQRGYGACDYAKIELRGDRGEVFIGP
ncbi:MAG: DUF3047 domain-containing protein [Methylovirgula sp.]|nr:DUF3047 domain-containing protein [Methylovirgula sp.]